MKHVHFIGIGGSGLSAIARLLLESGYTVTGSDRVLSPFAESLRRDGATVHIGHDASHIAGADVVIRSSAIPDDNPEVRAALQAGIPVLKRADFVGQLMTDKTGIAVAGTHGKTTTTAMIAWVLSELGLSPSFIIGGVARNFGVNARAGKGRYFVVEADEYDNMFLGLKPTIEVVTNVEHDHPDCFPTYLDMLSAFELFVDLLPSDGSLIACADDAGAASLLSRARRRGRRVIAYCLESELTVHSPYWVQAREIHRNARGGVSFQAYTNLGDRLRSVAVDLRVPGEHNVQNALAALTVADLLNLPLEGAARALSGYLGTGRRFELRGEVNGIAVYDDYAHHPTEIRATLAAARDRYPDRRIWAVWQPHTYSRTQALFDNFTRAFLDADEVIVTEVYAAREPKQEFSAEQVARAMRHDSVRFIPTLSEVSAFLLEHLHPGDVVLVLSAGDADQISAQVVAGLEKGEKAR
ncbi:MAG: UDP-N-acetylmuramate--L-alanine ligase [Anaerolineae bacterium]|nr:MAG: UDP-N-acetylmuramate--L-alanine ligase [Anaerolineae bacterium]